MKYIIETTPTGCKETLIYNDDKLGETVIENTATFIDACNIKLDNPSNTIVNQMKLLGFSEEIIEQAEELTGINPMFKFCQLNELLEGEY